MYTRQHIPKLSNYIYAHSITVLRIKKTNKKNPKTPRVHTLLGDTEKNPNNPKAGNRQQNEWYPTIIKLHTSFHLNILFVAVTFVF